MNDDYLAQNGPDEDRLTVDIECLDQDNLLATLISTTGNHCEVWRTSHRSAADNKSQTYLDFVIKWPLGENSMQEIRLLARQYRLLRDELEDIIPEALFVITRINGKPNVCVFATAVNVWFNMANPQNEEEAIELLRNHSKARSQLARFLNAARNWRNTDNPRIIDLYGLDNLIMDNNREIRYLDSFYVFFHEDMLHILDEPDPQLAEKILRSAKRLDYLEHIHQAAQSAANQPR